MSSGQTDAECSQLMEPTISQTDQQDCRHPDEESAHQNGPDNNEMRAHAVTTLSLSALSVMALSALNLSATKATDECYRWMTDNESSEITSAETELTDAWSSLSDNSELLSMQLNRATEQAQLYEAKILITENKIVVKEMRIVELQKEVVELKEQLSASAMDLSLSEFQNLITKSSADYYESAFLKSFERISQLTSELNLSLNYNTKQQDELTKFKLELAKDKHEKWTDADN